MRKFLGKFLVFIAIWVAVVSPSRSHAQASACGVTVNAGPDTTICAPGQVVSLRGTITGTTLTTAWTPTTGISNAALPTTTASVNTTTTYTLTARSLNAQNLIVNGNFSQGNTGFTSDYQLHTGTNNLPDGRYAIVRNARTIHSGFANCTERTGDNGFMMVVNASGIPNNVWCQTINVQANATYRFSAWVSSMVSQNPAQLQFSINGVLIGNVFQAPTPTCQWQEFTADWTAQTSATAQICIANVNLTPVGNDFALDDLSFREICTIQDSMTVTVATLNADWNSPGALCRTDATVNLNTLLSTNATPGGVWTLNGTATTTLDPMALAPGAYTLRYRVEQGNCNLQNEQTVQINAPPNSGIAAPPVRACAGSNGLINLTELLQGQDAGGIWQERSAVFSTGNAFSAASATFNTAGQLAGTYTFAYSINASPPCGSAETTVSVILEPLPTADAGPDLELNCALDMVTIGGPNTSVGDSFRYRWTAAAGSPILIPDIRFTEVERADQYTLEVTDTRSGCSARDQVTISAQITTPQATVEVKPVSCNQTRDGAIRVTSVSDGRAPFMYALNNGAFSAKNEFTSLMPGTYTITVKDANECEATVPVQLAQPEALRIAILTNRQSDNPLIINQGDSVRLMLQFSKPESAISSIAWQPSEIAACQNCTEVGVRPLSATTYRVRVTDESGCTASAEILLLVKQVQRVFIPTAFSPNGDGNNDVLYISAASEIKLVRNFRIMNRWGVMVFSREAFLPNDPAFGWDGMFNGQRSPTGVYVYTAELELTNGDTVIIAGDATLLY